MKTKFFFIAIAFTASLFFTSCEKDDEVAKPVITINELGMGDSHGNDHIAIIGSDLHIEAEIIAEGKIDKVQIRIHSEGEHEEEGGHEEWEIDTTYTKFSGLKNTIFHEHLDIALEAEPGEYHFDFVVTDMLGNQSYAEADLEIQQPDDDVAPEVNVTAAPSNNQVFNNGETISISGSVSDDKALGGIYIGLVRADQNLTDAEVNATNTITLLHTHDFDSTKAHNFSVNIAVGAAQDNNITPKDITGDIAWQSANYYILVKCTDAFGGNWTFSDRYPIEINY
ncbi:MAG: DUF4625 domain-containing protein [Mariniphaga sp.]|jgi:hypothetical protein|nr:DUF4625 domain-containing protein [Mariniphaga sp.]